MAETRITLEETNDFATALRARRLAIGMDLATLRTFLDRAYTAAQIDRWEAGASEPSIEEKAMILASLARVQNALLYEYEKIVNNVTRRFFPAPSKLFVPTTQKAYETFVDEFIVDELPLCAYQVLLGMLSSRLGIPLATLGGGRLN